MDIAAMFEGQGWFEIAGQVVLVGMAASKEVEKEIDEAKAKVRERTDLPDVLDGM